MTAEPTEDLQPLHITATDPDRDTSQDRFPFYLGDDNTVLIGTRPKMAVLLRLVAAMGDDADPFAQASAFDLFLDKVLDAESVKHIRARMEDDDDELDLDHPLISQLFQTLVGVWYGTRPTGGRRGSAASPSQSGRRSTARSQSRARTRSS